MLSHLELSGISKESPHRLDLGSRLNIITGNNGAGKSLLLDAAWYCLTSTWPTTWPGKGIIPHHQPAKLSWQLRQPPLGEQAAFFNFVEQVWKRVMVHLPFNALVIFARVDGGFSVFDPYRTVIDPRATQSDVSSIPPVALHFSFAEVWEGLPRSGSPATSPCEGMLRDWRKWALDREDGSFDTFKTTVATLGDGIIIEPLRHVKRLYVNDALEIPLLNTDNGVVEVVNSSAAVKRILAFAYMATWAWREHKLIAELTKRQCVKSMVVIFDEIESHLHPQWQRRIMAALLNLGGALAADVDVQSIVSTHSPLVLASVEPFFDVAKDCLFNIEIEDQKARVRKVSWTKQGDAVNWLVSESFGLTQGRSIEAEIAIEAAEAWMRKDVDALPQDLNTREQIHQELRRVLADHDDFWPRWIVDTTVRS